ncbi:nucleotide exchange factor GrpE [Falsiroseomonas selenitidurans]|uniref:Protein GrpE n=1 Tax=Falsiroseomonas selenitidurans TaxID=2716335 RepID=A0ABX1E6S6_9PROT|nr:nucleotide exchange factor GrpE [Falsiroseomonas selenitidurans]NKC32430.1 nucleotide exchange factor GrpE [Falsiroseomonas selenitidurans]
MSDTQDTPNPAPANTPADIEADSVTGAQTAPQTDAERIASLEAEVVLMRDKWLRAEAEMQNLRSRAKREAEDARLYAVQKFARDVVETAENLRRGLDSLPPPAEEEAPLLGKLRGGFEGVERAFVAMLERHGVARVEATGKAFDPELHQAMAEQPAPEGVEPGTVIQAWTPAWTLHGRLLKPAMVVVAGK